MVGGGGYKKNYAKGDGKSFGHAEGGHRRFWGSLYVVT